ncbi:MAG: imidazoleglycerol-phosphate dehydratase HisB [Proteobacteria bacterium]|nr:imidazoleglycerol-phosphate dehydratase HisB [Pseudomonadota bacterium]
MDTVEIKRTTKETEVLIKINIYGTGKSLISSGIPFFDHMLTLFSRHGFFDMELKAVGDVEVDFHHTVEDIGIVLGEAFKKSLGDLKSIRRFGFFKLPMDEALAEVVCDISGRPTLIYNVSLPHGKVGDFDIELIESFFKGFVDHCGITLHINLIYGKNTHHCIEAIFKAFAKSLSMAIEKEPRYDIPSTKGVL